MAGEGAAAQRGSGDGAAHPAAETPQSAAERRAGAGGAAAAEPAAKPGAKQLRTRADSAGSPEEKVGGPRRRSSDRGDKPKGQTRSMGKAADERPAGSPKSKGGGGGGGGAVLFEKVVTSSDAGGPGRVVIPKVRPSVWHKSQTDFDAVSQIRDS